MRGLTFAATDHLVTAPAREPLDLDEVKKAIFGAEATTSDDTLLDAWIMGARQYFEEQTGRQLLTATWEYWLDAFPCGVIELPHAPLQSVVHIKYVDGDGDVQTWGSSNYVVKAPSGPQCARGWIEPAYGVTWPSTRCESGAVRVQFLAGYGDAIGDIPELIRSALVLLVANFHHMRCPADKPVATLPMLGLPEIVRSYKSHPTKPLIWPGGEY